MLNLCSQASLVKWDVIRFNQSMAVYTASRSFSLSVHIMINLNLCWIFVPLVRIKYGFCLGKNLLSLLSCSTNSFLNSLRFAISPFTFITATLTFCLHSILCIVPSWWLTRRSCCFDNLFLIHLIILFLGSQTGPHLFESSDVNSLMSSILLIRSFLLRAEMDASSSRMFVWFIWCSWVLTKRNEKLAKQFIRTVHEQPTFLHFLGKCGNNKSVCIIFHIIVPGLVTFQISRRQTSYH